MPFRARAPPEAPSHRNRETSRRPSLVSGCATAMGMRNTSMAGPIAALADCDVLVVGHTHKLGSTTRAASASLTADLSANPSTATPRAAFAVLEVRGDDVHRRSIASPTTRSRSS